MTEWQHLARQRAKCIGRKLKGHDGRGTRTRFAAAAKQCSSISTIASGDFSSSTKRKKSRRRRRR